ncbi:MAG: hypothetical protein HRF43_19380 [Phycisphaerae bacterium]
MPLAGGLRREHRPARPASARVWGEGPRPVRAVLLACGVLLAAAERVPADGPVWKLIYYRQVGQSVNDNQRAVHNFCVRENGTRAGSTGLTDQLHPATAFFGRTDVNGYLAINPTALVLTHNVRVRESATVPSDTSPDFYFQSADTGRFYSYEAHWLRVQDDSAVYAYPTVPVYHYDEVDGISGSEGQPPPGYDGDAFGLDHGGVSTLGTYQAQTFKVPPGINRIITAKAFVVTAPGTHFQYRATIRFGGPDGPQVGAAVVSRDITSPDFLPVIVNWPLDGPDAAAVAPGGTYCLRLEPLAGGTFNAYATLRNTYADGQMYYGSPAGGDTTNAGHDLVAVVVGVGYQIAATPDPELVLDPPTLEHTFVRGQNLPDGAVYVTNAGGGKMTYTFSVEYASAPPAAWLSLEPTVGFVITETDAIAVKYLTAGLPPGDYIATIKAEAAAVGSPRYSTVTLHVLPPPFAPCDFDQDGDVDGRDFGRFQACIRGPGVVQDDPACDGAELDGDGDVDAGDLSRFVQCLDLSGPNLPLFDTTCADQDE